MKATFVNLTLIRKGRFIEVAAPGLNHGKTLGITASGDVLYISNQPHLIMILAGPNAKRISMDIYKDVKAVYQHRNVTENFINTLRYKLTGMRFEIERSKIPNIREVLKSLNLN